MRCFFIAMDRAYTSEYKLIFANEASKGRKYFCPACNGTLHFYPGKLNAPHFRHSKGVPERVKAACELYTQGLGENSIYDNEFRVRKNVRLVLLKNDKEFQFELKFPVLNQMLSANQYITYSIEEIKDFVLHSVHLHPSRKKLYYSVPLKGRYSINCSDEILERKLGLLVSGRFEPFKDGPLIFKEIQGEYISIPYRKLHITGKFYVVSYGPLLSLNKDIFCANTQKKGNFYIYEFYMPLDLTDEMIRWFKDYLNYTLQLATCMIDIYEPAIFKKQGSTIEITENKTTWVITRLKSRYENQRLIVVNPDNTRNVFSISSNNFVELTFQKYGDYLIYIDQEVSEMINIRYTTEIKNNYKFEYGLEVNEKNVLFEENIVEGKEINLSSILKVEVQRPNLRSYGLNNCMKESIHAPARIDIPTLWSVKITDTKILQINQVSDLEYLFGLYNNAHLFPKVVCGIQQIQKLEKLVKSSDFVNRVKLLTYIRKFGIKVPSNVNRYIKEYFK